MLTYWFYESLSDRRRSVTVHAGRCRTCNEGRGYEQRLHNRLAPAKRAFGRWHGPFASIMEATAVAQRLFTGSSRRVRHCRFCLDTQSDDPMRRRTPVNRSQGATFWVQLGHDGSVFAHVSTCPCFTNREPAANNDGKPGRPLVSGGSDWYGPYERLAPALAKVEELIQGTARGRMRQCMICASNDRLSRLDDLRAGAFIGDPSNSLAPSAASISSTARMIICLECGKGRRQFERHLREMHQLTPDQYRQKRSLPADYPMIPPGHKRQMLRAAQATRTSVRKG